MATFLIKKKIGSRRNCCVPQCSSTGQKSRECSFHIFPKKGDFVSLENAFGVRERVDRRKKWIHILRIGKEVSKEMYVCSKHFLKTDYFLGEYSNVTTRYLKKNAIPSQNLPITPRQSACNKNRTRTETSFASSSRRERNRSKVEVSKAHKREWDDSPEIIEDVQAADLLLQFGSSWQMNNSFTSLREHLWCPMDLFVPKTDDKKIAIVILNRPVLGSLAHIKELWQRAVIRVTVDGGTDRWLSYLQENNLQDILPPPDIITGDMDSVLPETLELFKKSGSQVICTMDQNETDFTKALRQVTFYMTKYSKQINSVIAVADTSGRIDHIMANINTLYKARGILSDVLTFLLSRDSLSWLLPPGKHIIRIPKQLLNSKSWCSLIPIGHKCDCVTTTGLKWNLTDAVLQFGEMVSTSNTYSGAPVVSIDTSSTLLWGMGIEAMLPSDNL